MSNFNSFESRTEKDVMELLDYIFAEGSVLKLQLFSSKLDLLFEDEEQSVRVNELI